MDFGPRLAEVTCQRVTSLLAGLRMSGPLLLASAKYYGWSYNYYSSDY